MDPGVDILPDYPPDVQPPSLPVPDLRPGADGSPSPGRGDDGLPPSTSAVEAHLFELKGALMERELENVELRDEYNTTVSALKSQIQRQHDAIERLEARSASPSGAYSRPVHDGTIYAEYRLARAQLDAATSGRKEAEAQVAALTQRLTECEAAHAATSDRLHRLLATREEDVAALARQVHALEGHNARLQASQHDGTAAVDSLQSEVSCGQRRIAALEDQVQDLESQLRTALSTLKRLRDRESAAVAALTGQNSAVTQLQDTLHATKQRVATLQARVSDAETAASEWKAAAQTARDDLDAFRARSERTVALSDELLEVKSELQHVKQQATAWQSRCGLVEQQLSEARVTHAEAMAGLQAVADNRAAVIAGLQADLRAVEAAGTTAPAADTPGSPPPAAASPGDGSATKLRLQLESTARQLAEREAAVTALQDRNTELTALAERLRGALEEAADRTRDWAGGHSDGAATTATAGSAADGADAAATAPEFARLQQRDVEAEAVFHRVHALVARVQRLAVLLHAKLEGGTLDMATLADGGGVDDEPPPVATVAARGGDGDRRQVVDRTALLAGLDATSADVAHLHRGVAAAMQETLEDGCAMQ